MRCRRLTWKTGGDSVAKIVGAKRTTTSDQTGIPASCIEEEITNVRGEANERQEAEDGEKQKTRTRPKMLDLERADLPCDRHAVTKIVVVY